MEIGLKEDGFYLPYDIMDIDELSIIEKLFLCEIINLADEKNALCNINDKYLSKVFDRTIGRCAGIVSNLIKKGYINEKNMDEFSTKEYILNNKGSYICKWCKIDCHSLQAHHYPIPKSEGGKDVVYICGTCHCDFHSLNDGRVVEIGNKIMESEGK